MADQDAAIKAAEARGYSKGYAAGQRRKAREITREQLARQREAFRLRAFLAALPVCMQLEGWRRGEKPITSVEDRVRLARDFADESTKQVHP